MAQMKPEHRAREIGEALRAISNCSDCGRPMSKAEGGTVFTVCSDCWSKYRFGTAGPIGERLGEMDERAKAIGRKFQCDCETCAHTAAICPATESSYVLEIAGQQLAMQGLAEALDRLYKENIDYITINHLGDPHHNQSMKNARAALLKAKPFLEEKS